MAENPSVEVSNFKGLDTTTDPIIRDKADSIDSQNVLTDAVKARTHAFPVILK